MSDAVSEPRPEHGHDPGAEHVTGGSTSYEDPAREEFGGMNWGACFFGWLVATALAVLLSSIVGAIATALGGTADVTQTEAERAAGTIGIVAAVVLAIVLFIGYYAGGYVAGRMSRFDGTRQGLGVWLIGIIVTVLAVAVGVTFGSAYNILDRVDLPRVPVPTDQMNLGAIITGLVVLLGTLLAALLGGRTGHRYHHLVDLSRY